MNRLYLGIDTGRIYTKGLIIDEYNNIIASSYIPTKNSSIESVKKLIKELKSNIYLDKYKIVSIGVTGSARRLIGAFLNASIIKNEIKASAEAIINLYPEAKTIIELGGHDTKIINIKDKSIIDYSIYDGCKIIPGSIITNITDKLNIDILKINELTVLSKNRIDFDEKCSLFEEKEIINKIQLGYPKEDLLAGVSHLIAKSFINNINKPLPGPIIFIGGASKNIVIKKELEKLLNNKIIVPENSNLISAYGMALMARAYPKEITFNYDIEKLQIETKVSPCKKCEKECLILSIYKNNKLVDYWGNRCDEKII